MISMRAGVIAAVVAVSSAALAAASPTPAPKPRPAAPAPAKPTAKKPSAKAGPSKREQAAAISVAAAETARQYTSCASFEAAKSSWVPGQSTAAKVGTLLGFRISTVDFDKGEFEKTEEYQARVRNHSSVFVGDPDRMMLAIPIDGEHQSYDADSGVLAIDLPTSSPRASLQQLGGLTLLDGELEKSLGFQMGQTRMGVKFRYQSVIRVESFVSMNADDAERLFNARYSQPPPSVRLSVDRPTALSMNSHLMLVMLAKLVAPGAREADDEDVASLDDPVSLFTKSEVWSVSPQCAYIYDTGRRLIVHTFAPSAPPAPAAAARTPLRPAVSVITQPDWLRKPTAAEVERYFPERALQLEKGGEVRMTCTVKADGTLEDCRVVFETPAGYGFGAAALKMAGSFKMKPDTRDGEPVAGASVTIPIPFKLQ